MRDVLIKIVVVAFSFMLVGCSGKKDNNTLVFNINKEGNYEGFDSIRDFDNPQKAIQKGCYVKENDGFKGEENWNNFIKRSSNNENTSLRIIMMDGDTTNNYVDLFYQDGLYYVFNQEINDIAAEGYKYLLTLKSEVSEDGKAYDQVVLSNDRNITFADVFNDLASSEKIIDSKEYKLVITDIEDKLS